MRVVVYEQPNLELSKAEKFGDIEFMFTDEDYRPSIWETESFEAACSKKLDAMKFDPKNDMFVFAGSSVPLMIITNVLTRKYKEFKVLFWHAQVRDYVPRIIQGIQQ